MLNDKTILITGGTGSFGKKFTKRVLEKLIRQLIQSIYMVQLRWFLINCL